VDLLEPFDNATTYFSGTSYATLSIIYPLIQVLKFKYAYESFENDDNNLEIEQGKFVTLLLYILFEFILFANYNIFYRYSKFSA